MKLVMTLLVRDEEDILREHLDYHLNAGVDLVIATDHRSRDGTTEILESYARQDVLVLLREEGEHTRQGTWQTRMARLAVTEYGADWVINSDADEFWWPRSLSLKGVLMAVPRRFGVVYGRLQNFVPELDGDGWFIERLTFRLAEAAPINDPTTPFRPVVKAAHRADPQVVVAEGGSHRVYGVAGEVLSGWYPLDVLHFPFRSREQSAHKYWKTWTGWERNLRGDLTRARKASDAGRLNAIWDRIALDAATLENGLETGALVVDTRLQDAFRELAATAPVPALPTRAELDTTLALDSAVFEEAELVRYTRWADDLASRLLKLERA
jgi:Glycosyl transferase family 2